MNNIISQSECPTTEHFYDYLEKNLSKKENYVFESHLNNCEFCQDALEGFSITDKKFVLSSIREINSNIDEKTNSGFSIKYIAAAASVIIALFFGSMYFLQDVTNTEQLSLKTQKEEELNKDKLAPVEQENVLEEEFAKNNEKSLESKEEPLDEKKISKTSVEIQVLDKEEKVINHIFEEEEISVEEDLIDELTYDDSNEKIIESIEEETEGVRLETSANMITREVELEETISSKNKDDGNEKYKTIDFEHLLSFANETSETLFNSESKTKKTRLDNNSNGKNESTYGDEEPIYNNNNREEIQEQLDLVNDEQYKNALEKINFLLTKDVWESEETATFNWLKIICELKLGLSAKETLQELRRNKNPYQVEAKKLYKQLY